MSSAVDVVETLCHRYAFGDVRALLPMLELPADELRRLRRLCLFGQRLLDLDAEDFDMSDTESGGEQYSALVNRARASRMPQSAREASRGALSSMQPAYRLLLEILRARYVRHEMAGLVATAHIISEYLPMLVWEAVWGHSADPLRIAGDVGGAGSLFGESTRECAHNRPDSSAAARIQNISKAPPVGWQSYLDRQHSNVAHALGVCAAECSAQCSVFTRIPKDLQPEVTQRCEIALAFGKSTLIKLRHAAPVGHGFGVPSTKEVETTWQHTREVLAKRGGVAETVLSDDGFCLPGLPSLLSALAGATVVPDTLLRDTAALTSEKLRDSVKAGSAS